MTQPVTGMLALRFLLLGTGVIIVTPLLSGVIPDIANLGMITVGVAVSAGIAAFGISWVLDQFMK